MMNATAAISVRNLTVRFGDLVVLDNVNLVVPKGSTTGIIGPNGAGKTTLFHALTGDLDGRSGEVMVNGTMVQRRDPSKVASLGLGKLFQDVRVFRNLTVRENILAALHDEPQRAWHRAWFRRAGTQETADQKERVNTILNRIALAPEADCPAGGLSFGHQKTLALGRLMAGRFSILLLDEPMAGLSPQMAGIVGSLIEEMVHDNGTTVLLIEHNMQHVRRLCETTVVLNRGKVVAHGATANVLGDVGVREICLGL